MTRLDLIQWPLHMLITRLIRILLLIILISYSTSRFALAGGIIYWTNARTIQRANLDGTERGTLIRVGEAEAGPFGLALDIPCEKMYWTTATNQDTIQRGDLDGTRAEVKNLVLRNPNIHSESNNQVGALAGYMRNGTIQSCSVIGGSISGRDYVGGLVGNTSFAGHIIQCSSQGIVSGTEGGSSRTTG